MSLSDRMVPLDISDPEPPTDVRNCAHSEACRRVFERESSLRLGCMDYDDQARMLGCGTCDLWEEA